MENGSIIVDLIIILLIVIPIGYLVIFSFNREKKTRKKFMSMCSKNGLTISEFEITGDLIMGIDNKKKVLAFSKRENLEDKFQVISLSELNECQTKTIKHSKKSLDWVGLELKGTNLHREIPFYVENDEEESSTSAEVCLQTARKWERLILPLVKAS